MYKYAIYEAQRLVGGLPSPIDDRCPTVRYLCALFSELAYYHIAQWELDDKKRAKLIPCEAYRALVAGTGGSSTGVAIDFSSLDFPRGFVVADRGGVAVGIVLNRLLFIGFRGTQFLFDWKVNLRSKLVPVNAGVHLRPSLIFNTVCGRLHSGFSEEAARISARVLDAIRDANFGDIDHVFLTGHSLGGAVAAISENFIKVAPTSVCILGAPRYSDLSAYISLPHGPPAQVRREGDVVPTVPPRAFGYVDHPYEFTTSGTEYVDPAPYYSKFGGLIRWIQFLAGRFEPHDMETYRNELGSTAGAQGAMAPLAPVERVKAAHIESAT